MKLISFILLFTGFLIYSFFNLGKFLDVTQEPSKTELLVCLGGGISKNRIEKTIELYKNGFLEKNHIIFTGVSTIKKINLSNFDSNTNVIINGNLKNTMEEILFIKTYMKENNLSSVTFITEVPHSKRIKIFWNNFGENLENVTFSVVASNFEKWNSSLYYKDKLSLKYALSEITKLIYNFFLYGILETFGLKEEFESTYKKELREMKKDMGLPVKYSF